MTRARVRPACLLIAVLAAGCSTDERADGSADTPAAAMVAAASTVVAEWVDAERVPGAVLLVSSPDGVVMSRAWGSAQLYEFGEGQYADAGGIVRLETPRPMTTETVFDLASVTKVMATTMAIMLLVDREQLDVDAPVSRYLPDFTGGGKETVTLRHLLTHRSGLSQWQPTYYHASSSAEAYAFVRDLPLAWEVGRERHYSDLGFMLLGMVVERVSGVSLDAFVRDEIYAPLGLEHTGFRPSAAIESGGGTRAEGAGAGPGGPFAATSHGNPFERRMVHDPEFGYRIEGDPDAWDDWRTYTLDGEVNDGNAHHAFGGVAGHAGLFSTAADLTVLLRLLLDHGAYDGVQFIDPGTVERFLAPTGDAQALGWQLPDWAPAGSFAHTGFTGTFVLAVPDRGLTIVLLTNRLNLGVDAETQYPDVGALQRGVTLALTQGG